MSPDQVTEAEVDRYIAMARRNITGACNYVDWINYDHPKARAFFAELRAEGWNVFEFHGTYLNPGRSLQIESKAHTQARLDAAPPEVKAMRKRWEESDEAKQKGLPDPHATWERKPLRDLVVYILALAAICAVFGALFGCSSAPQPTHSCYPAAQTSTCASGYSGRFLISTPQSQSQMCCKEER